MDSSSDRNIGYLSLRVRGMIHGRGIVLVNILFFRDTDFYNPLRVYMGLKFLVTVWEVIGTSLKRPFHLKDPFICVLEIGKHRVE